MKSNQQKIIGAILTFCISLCLVIGQAVPAAAATLVSVTSSSINLSDGKFAADTVVKLAAAADTITISGKAKNAVCFVLASASIKTIELDGAVFNAVDGRHALTIDRSVMIKTVGASTLTAGRDCSGIKSTAGTVTFTGSGKLKSVGQNAPGIDAVNITVDGGQVEGCVTEKSVLGHGVLASGKISVQGDGSLKGTGAEKHMNGAIGIHANAIAVNKGTVEGMGKEGSGIVAETIDVISGAMTGTGLWQIPNVVGHTGRFVIENGVPKWEKDSPKSVPELDGPIGWGITNMSGGGTATVAGKTVDLSSLSQDKTKNGPYVYDSNNRSASTGGIGFLTTGNQTAPSASSSAPSSSGKSADELRAIFDKHYQNKVLILTAPKAGTVSFKADFTGMKTDDLVFYRYDSDKNSFSLIQSPEYSVSGETLKFTASAAGEIVIVSSGKLVKK